MHADRSLFWLVPGMLCVAGFAVLLTRAEVAFAGRAYAAYGGVYIAGALVILTGPRP